MDETHISLMTNNLREMPRLPQILVPLGGTEHLHAGLTWAHKSSACVLRSGAWQGSILSPGNPGSTLRTRLVCLDSGSPSLQEGVGPCSVYFGEIETSALM